MVFGLARYPLIIRDQDYVELVRMRAVMRKSIGKMINEAIRDYIKKHNRQGGLPSNPICIYCGRAASFVGFGEGQQKFYVCNFHKRKLRDLKSFKPLK